MQPSFLRPLFHDPLSPLIRTSYQDAPGGNKALCVHVERGEATTPRTLTYVQLSRDELDLTFHPAVVNRDQWRI